MERNYRFILFDADDTLVDYAADSRRAFCAALRAVGREDDAQLLREWTQFDYGNWERVGLSDVHLPAVQSGFHEMYRTHVRDIFAHAAPLSGGRAEEAERAFLSEFAREGTPIAGAKETVRALCERGYGVYAATNGLASLQKTRLGAFRLGGVFVSEELGAIKPSEDFFRAVLFRLGAEARECVMVGDSLSSDIAGARAVGMDCVWFDRRGGTCPAGVRRMRDLRELLTWL